MVKNILIGMLIILTIAAAILYQNFAPKYATSLQFQGQTIRIQRDHYGIPHIYAPDRRSFLYGLGYVQAEDRLFQCTIRRIVAKGRLSEYLGQKTIPIDTSMRDLGLQQLGEHIVAKMKEENRQAYDDFDSYAQGMNQGVADRRAYPIQFHILGIQWQQWTVADVYTLQKMLEWTVSHNLNQQYTRSGLLANYTVEQINKMLPIHQENWAFDDVTTIKDHDIPAKFINHQYFNHNDFDALQIGKIISLGSPEVYFGEGASNAWVVSGKHTKSGKAMLVADPHLEAYLPSHWYQFRTNYNHEGHEVRFAGVSPPGIPTPYGKNDYFALACTILQTDTQDGFKQKIEGNKYLIDGEWKQLRTRSQLIKVKGDKDMRTINHTVRYTHRGPVMNYLVSSIGMYDIRDEPISISWTGYNQDYMSIVHAARNIEVRNLQQLKFTLGKGTQYFLSISALAITEDGHIGYAQFGVNPKRPKHRLGSYISDGTTSKNDWLGTLPYQDRMMVFDPIDGFIATCNNRVASSNYQGGYFDTAMFTARATRLEQMIRHEIDSGRKIDTQFAKKTLYDTVDIYCRQIMPEILSSLPQSEKLLGHFDCDFKPSSYQATIYEIFFFQLWKETKPLPENNINYLSLYSAPQSLYNHVHRAYEGKQIERQQMREAWSRMLARLQNFFQTNDVKKWRWGLFHRDIAKQIPLGNHPAFAKLYNRQAAGWGNLHTLNVARAAKIQEQDFATTNRANLRTIFDFGGPDYWVSDAGSSQNLLSPHYDDQWKLFISQKLLPLYPDPNNGANTGAEL